MPTIQKFEDLEIWQIARTIAKEIHEFSLEAKISKDYSLKDQMNRSAGSIMNNIAEGFGRNGRLEFINFITIANGSCTELMSQLYRCLDKKYVNEDRFKGLYELIEFGLKKNHSMINYLKKTDIKGQKFKDRK